MGRRARLNPTTVLLVVAGIGLLVCAAISYCGDYLSRAWDVSPQKLVYHTDHRAVLDAINRVITDPQAAGVPPFRNGRAMVAGSQGGGRVPASLPSALTNLEFEFMDIDDRGSVMIFFGGGFGHWGYTNRPPDGGRQKPSQWQLIPGLWYWSENSGSLPRDLTKYPYFRTSKRLLVGGSALLAIAVVIRFRGRRPSEHPEEQTAVE